MPLAEIAKKYEITPSMVSELKEEFLAGASQVFAPKTEQSEHQEVVRLRTRESDLLRKIGQLQVDNDFFASACEDAGESQIRDLAGQRPQGMSYKRFCEEMQSQDLRAITSRRVNLSST